MAEKEELLVKQVEDITETWVLGLLHHSLHAPVRLRRWSRVESSSRDTLAGFSSSRATIEVEYEVEGEATLKKETYVVKVIPTEGHMAGLLTSEGMHHVEVGQYGRFLRALGAWETEKLGAGVGVVAEIVPAHALALSTPHHFTLVLPEITNLGYQIHSVVEGLGEAQVVAVASKMGRFHGTTVSYKVLTGANLQTDFPKCFHQGNIDSPVFSVFARAGFERLREEWSRDASRRHLLELLEPYEAIFAEFVIASLKPEEPFATALHGDLQPSNIFFKHDAQGQLTIKLIDWATARYSQGPIDLVYLLNIGVDPEVRRKVTLEAKEAYFEAFNASLADLKANMSYPRDLFEEQFARCRQMMVVWSVMCFNIFFSTPHLMDRLVGIISDVLLDPSISPPTLPPSAAHPTHSPST
nr:uncharacterized protein LOC123756498 [Procambarus clarkii]XP_045595683.1 uncharacterized protein LOC123756498 [Procambarus clarkii]XP_045595684.1 uncharacterized protein LOC123756498 [Procambarus clarkii]